MLLFIIYIIKKTRDVRIYTQTFFFWLLSLLLLVSYSLFDSIVKFDILPIL